MTLIVRYDFRRSNGETRRDYNARFNQPSPDILIPPEYDHFFAWFWDISNMIDRNGDGYCRPIAPGDYKAWLELSGEIVEPADYDILRAMDKAYVAQMNVEIQDDIKRRQAENK